MHESRDTRNAHASRDTYKETGMTISLATGSLSSDQLEDRFVLHR
ncbi:hypothetical protein ABT317_43775 [Streptomyces carpinensis]|uniref:Uncharacterized protein n=1 Tax=Streptomyces carpinensis TaxID=66369 RepID=A0ABV1WHQ1_9ACTN